MARPKDCRRVGKDELALAVRKDFNAATVTEPELITSFLYAVHNQGKPVQFRVSSYPNHANDLLLSDKSFRMRYDHPPNK